MKNNYKEKLKGKTILVTGGTGSFGNSFVNKVLELDPKRIVIFSRGEKKQSDMRNRYNDPRLTFIIGNVRDSEVVDRVMSRIKVDYIFHAAALKQVPTCEFFPMEAVKTNVLGAYNVINAAIDHNVKKIVILSTDKAAYPINAMGMTKALMEKVMISFARRLDNDGNGNTKLCGTRYGNVLYTRGSVVPYFVDLMKKGKKLTVTDFKMTRFLLSLEESVDLVLYALTSGKNGYMYVRKAPSCTLEMLTKALCEVFNYKEGYKEVGVRAGEKMHETLVTKEEFSRAIDKDTYYGIAPESQGLDYDRYFSGEGDIDLQNIEAYTSKNARRLTLKETINVLLDLPEIQEELHNFKGL